MTTAAGTEQQAAGAARMERYGRPRSAWMRSWPMLPILLFLLAAFVYPVVQLLWLSLFGKTARLHDRALPAALHGAGLLTVLRNTSRSPAGPRSCVSLVAIPSPILLATTTQRSRSSRS